jgi:hypothetical protein
MEFGDGPDIVFMGCFFPLKLYGLPDPAKKNLMIRILAGRTDWNFGQERHPTRRSFFGVSPQK